MRMMQMLGKTYVIGVMTVTQLQWRQVMGTEPWSSNKRLMNSDAEYYPATYISWYDAMAFCIRLSNMEGSVYRLPTEAELVYAYSIESSLFRFCHVWEWCSDHHISQGYVNYTVIYGDSWRDTSGYNYASCREHNKPESCMMDTGFRLVRTVAT